MIFKSLPNLLENLKSLKKLPGIILIYGNQFDNLEKIYTQMGIEINTRYSQADTVSLNGTETDPSTFHAELSTIPMFGGPRLILIRHADNLLKKISANKTILAYFLRDFENIYEKTFLILQTESSKLPSVFDKAFEESFILEEFKIYSRDIPDIVKSRVHTMGFEITDDAVMELTRKYSLNPTLVNKALDRLFLYCLNEKKISKEDISDLSFDSEGDFLFEIIDCISDKNTDKAARLLEKSDFNNAAGFMSVLTKFFTDSCRYLKLKKLSLGIKEIHERLDLNTKHTFIFRKNEERFNQTIQKYSENELMQIIETLFELDRGIKENSSSDLQKNLILMFIFSLKKRST